MTSVARREDDSGEYSDASQDIELNNSGNDNGQQESDYDSHGSDSERSDRDPDSQETERRVDDDEDRSNPQYIPKRGTFYEHDDRTAASGEESSNTTSETASEKKEGSETPAERRRAPRKSDIINKWSHDKYNENEQVPKSRDELVAIYGYDIRNEDAPPHARRNRRYGRGPNKYTRTWEDEEAYKRQSAAQPQPRKPPNPEEFPELDASAKKYSRKPRTPRPRSKSQPNSNESLENGTNLRRNASIKTTKGKSERPVKANLNKSNMRSSPKPSPKDKMPPIENLTITATVNNNNQGPAQRRVSASVAQQRPVPTDQAKKKQPPPQQPNNIAPNKSPPQPQPQQPKPQPQNQPQQQPQAPAGAEARGGSKRYSSLRQRPLAETYSPQPPQPPQPSQPPQPQPQQQPQQSQQQTQQQPQQQPQQQIRYAEYGPGGAPAPHQGSPGPVPQMHPPQLIHQQVHRAPAGGVQPQHGPSPPHQQLPQPQHSQQQVRLGMLEQQQLVSHPHPHTIHNLPQPHTIGQLQPTQAYAPPAMMPAQYMQPAAGASSGAVFGGAIQGAIQGAMYAQPPAPYPMFTPHHNYATQAGGVTYYNCAEQELPQQPRAQRRPTAAIPIVRPAAPERPANSTEKDNIDRIVENMFVRKPWPATHGADSKDKPTDRSSQEPPSKDSSQPNSLTSSSISTDSKPSESKEEREEKSTEERREENEQETEQETIQDA